MSSVDGGETSLRKLEIQYDPGSIDDKDKKIRVKSNDRLNYVISDLIIDYVIKYLESRLFYSTANNLMELGPKKHNVPPKYGKSNNCLN